MHAPAQAQLRGMRPEVVEVCDGIYSAMGYALGNVLYVETDDSLVVIDTTEIDFVRHEGHLDELVDQIRKMERGVQYYRPLGSTA